MRQKSYKGGKMQEFFAEWWRWIQMTYSAENDADCEQIASEGKKLVEKYRGTEAEVYAQKMVLSHCEVIDERWKEEHGL